MLDFNEYGEGLGAPIHTVKANQVIMYAFTPRSHGSIALRPMQYSFTDELIEDLVGGPHASLQQNAADAIRNGSEAACKAITPQSIPIEIDTHNFDNMWSFVLTFGLSNPHGSGRSTFAPVKRKVVLTGYFIDEPFAQNTLWQSEPSINPNAVLLFTHNSSIIMTESYGATSAKNFSMRANNDLVHQYANANSVEPLALVDASSISETTLPSAFDEDDDQQIFTDVNIHVSSFDDRSRTVGATVNSPASQLAAIGGAVDVTQATIRAQQGRFGSMAGLGADIGDPFDMFTSSVYQNIASCSGTVDGSLPINPNISMTMSELDRAIDGLEVIPLESPSVPDYDTLDQCEINIENTANSLIDSTVTALASEYMFSVVKFRYSTWDYNGGSRMSHGSTGVWEVFDGTATIIDDPTINPDEFITNSLVNFRTALEMHLFPVLEAMGGDFDMMVSFDMCASTLISFSFLDRRLITSEPAYYEAHNKLGGLTSHVLGSQATLENNSSQLTGMVDRISTKTAGIYIPDGEF